MFWIKQKIWGEQYFKLIRHVLKESINDEKFIPKKPLETIFPTVSPDKSKSKPLSKNEIIKIIGQKSLLEADPNELHKNFNLFNTINFFLFSFFAYGMRFGDLARLKWGNLQGDPKNQKIHYKMTKTNHDHTLMLFDQLVEILRYYLPIKLKILYLQIVKDVDLFNSLTLAQKDSLSSGELLGHQEISKNSTFFSEADKNIEKKFKDHVQRKSSMINIQAIRKFIMINTLKNPNEYIFPILAKKENEMAPELFYKHVESKLTIYNHNLERIRSRCNINRKITSHIARHSFSFLSPREGASVYEISTSLNHQELSTTQHYLSGDSSFIDESISDIYNKMFKKQKK